MRCPNPVALPTGGVALFHSHWPEKYRFGAWLTDSEIALATAATADGPFVSHGVILKGSGEASAWDRDAVTDPCVLQHHGKWFLYYMGTHGDEPHPKLETPGWWVYRNNQRIGCAVADRPEGPWKRLGQLDVMPPEGVLCSNPVVCETKDGRFLMVFKWVENRRPAPAYGPIHIGSAIADSPSGPFRLVAKEVFPVPGVNFPGEEPCLWREGGRLCCLIHDKGTNYSAFPRALIRFESEDGISWTKKGVEFKRESIDRLERPFLLVQNDAKPVLFATAKDNSRTYKTRIVALTKE